MKPNRLRADQRMAEPPEVESLMGAAWPSAAMIASPVVAAVLDLAMVASSRLLAIH
jgi:hypothetical protein